MEMKAREKKNVAAETKRQMYKWIHANANDLGCKTYNSHEMRADKTNAISNVM